MHIIVRNVTIRLGLSGSVQLKTSRNSYGAICVSGLGNTSKYKIRDSEGAGWLVSFMKMNMNSVWSHLKCVVQFHRSTHKLANKLSHVSLRVTSTFVPKSQRSIYWCHFLYIVSAHLRIRSTRHRHCGMGKLIPTS